jgi:hypothetical protein
MKTIQKWLIRVIVVGCILLASVPASAQQDPKPKSVGVAVLLGIDPIPGDALFYAGKTTQGTVNAFLGTLAIASIGYAIYDNKTCDKKGSEGWCGFGSALLAVFVGAPVYLSTVIWDAIGGIHGVNKHNAEIEQNKKTSFLRTFQPALAVAPGGAFVGAKFTF